MLRLTIRRADHDTVAVGPLDVFASELLHQIAASARDETEEVRARLFPSPTAGRDRSLDEDWSNYVTPGLRELFAGSLEIIEQDLADFPEDSTAAWHTLQLPLDHLNAWIHGLNQARLALAARFAFTEKEIEGRLEFADDQRALALLQIHFYGFLQESFLQELEG